MRVVRATLFLMTLLAPAVFACDLPVFRWALENWGADPYEIVVFHDGPLAPVEAEVVDALRAATTAESGLANATVTTANTGQPLDPFFAALLAAQPDPALPWMVVRYPHALPNPSYVWSGPLNAANAAALLDSPARREIARRLGEDTTAVWVYLETGDVKRDAGRRETLEGALRAMSKTIEITPLDIDTNEAAEPVPWDLQFSLLAIQRDDPAEQPFVQMLLRSEGDLNGIDAPMAFPVFGRGRALYALVDGGIAPDLVEEACMYIAGRCTCEVKDLNPGIDLLMTCDWDQVMGESMMAPTEPPGAAQLAAVHVPASAPAGVEDVPVEAAAVAPGSAMARNLLVAGGLCAIALVAGTALLLRRPVGQD